MGGGHEPRSATNRGAGHLSRVVQLDVAVVDRGPRQDAGLADCRHHIRNGDNGLIHLGERRVDRRATLAGAFAAVSLDGFVDESQRLSDGL